MDNIEKIKKLKEEKNAIILAHYYVDEEVQKIADYIHGRHTEPTRHR